MKYPLAIGKKPSRSSKRGHKQKKGWQPKLRIQIERLRKEIEEISEEQKGIKEGQREVREKFQIIESKCEQLRKESTTMLQQSGNTQLRIALMFHILKARENKDFTKASQLTHALRELIVEQNKEKNAWAATC